MKFTSNRDLVIRSKNTGHAIEFKKGVPTNVPAGMHSECMEKGVLPVEENGKPVDPAEHQAALDKKVELPPEDGNERAAAIVVVMKELVKRNNSKDFTGGGCPSADAITAALRYKVDAKEVRDVWEKNRRELLNAPVK